jgi:hypothetical protein
MSSPSFDSFADPQHGSSVNLLRFIGPSSNWAET